MTPSSANADTYRARLFGIAYRMLGDVQDAEDLVQEAMLRWHQADRAAVREPEAWLVSVVTRLSIDRLRHVATQHAEYPGPWLPEPIADERLAPDRSAEIASDLSMAFLVLLERLAPEERAAFLLREDDKAGLLAVMADDVSWTSDGGGKVPATRRTVLGSERVVRLLMGYEMKHHHPFTYRVEIINGEPALVSYVRGRIFAVTFCQTDGERIAALYRVMNPDKLTHLGAPLHHD